MAIFGFQSCRLDSKTLQSVFSSRTSCIPRLDYLWFLIVEDAINPRFGYLCFSAVKVVIQDLGIFVFQLYRLYMLYFKNWLSLFSIRTGCIPKLSYHWVQVVQVVFEYLTILVFQTYRLCSKTWLCLVSSRTSFKQGHGYLCCHVVPVVTEDLIIFVFQSYRLYSKTWLCFFPIVQVVFQDMVIFGVQW